MENQNQHQKQERKRKRKLLLIILLLLLLFSSIVYYVFDMYAPRNANFGEISGRVLVNVPEGQIPPNTLYITRERRLYEQASMTLIVPHIKVDTTIGNSTEPEGLKQMAGLYEFSQLPGEGNVNVSIAGHRDIHDMVFYELDKLKENDYAYLIYKNQIFRYIYVDTKVVKPKQWEVIMPQGFSCLTLTTCDPIGTSRNRMIVRMKLVDHEAFSDSYQYTESAQS